MSPRRCRSCHPKATNSLTREKVAHRKPHAIKKTILRRRSLWRGRSRKSLLNRISIVIWLLRMLINFKEKCRIFRKGEGHIDPKAWSSLKATRDGSCSLGRDPWPHLLRWLDRNWWTWGRVQAASVIMNRHRWRRTSVLSSNSTRTVNLRHFTNPPTN